MSPRLPSFTSALLHFLVATMGIVYLVVAGIHVHRGNDAYAYVNILITIGLTVIVHLGSKRHGGAFGNFTLRWRHKRLRKDETCDWCGETVEAGSSAVSHRGAVEREPFLLHHHPECESATHSWYETNAALGARNLPRPTSGSMRRGSPDQRDTR